MISTLAEPELKNYKRKSNSRPSSSGKSSSGSRSSRSEAGSKRGHPVKEALSPSVAESIRYGYKFGVI